MTSTFSNPSRWRAFALLAVAFFMTIIDLTIVNVSLPTIGRVLHFSPTSLQWVVTAYSLTFGGFLLLGGRAADLLGRRRILMLGLASFTAASLWCAVSTSEVSLIAGRGVQGLGAAVMLPAALSIVMNMFTEGGERNKALGIWGALGASGGSVGLVIGGLLTRYAGWQYIFYLNVPIGAVVLALVPRLVPESRLAGDRKRFDAAGAIVGTGGLVLLVDAISQAPQYGWGATRTIAVLSASVALLVAFVVIESRVQSPLLPLSIFRLRSLAGANAVGLLLGGSFFAFFFAGTLYMQQVLHYSALQTGIAWLATSLTSVMLAGLSQLLVTRIGAKIVMAIGMALIGTGVIWATQVPVDGHFLADLAGPMVVAGAGTAFAFIPVSIAALAGVAQHQAGLASGLLNTSQQIGGALGDRRKRCGQPHQGSASRRCLGTGSVHRRLSSGVLGPRRDRGVGAPGNPRADAATGARTGRCDAPDRRSLAGGAFEWRRAGQWLCVAVIAVAAIYQLTIVKARWLTRCHGPAITAGGTVTEGAREGIRAGLRCVASSWALMAVLFALGVMSLEWMALVAGLIALERIAPVRWWSRGGRLASIRIGSAALLLALAVALAVRPGSVPGFTVPGSAAARQAMTRMSGMRMTGTCGAQKGGTGMDSHAMGPKRPTSAMSMNP